MSSLSKGTALTLIKRIFPYIQPFMKVLLLGITANIFYVGIDALATYLIKPMMEHSFSEQNVAYIKKIPLVLFFGIILRGVVCALAGYCMTYVSRQVVKTIRQVIFKHILYLPASDYDKSSSGTLLSKLLYDVEQVSQISADAITTFIQSIFLVMGLLVVMLVINWQLSLLFLSIVPFIALIVSYTNRRTRLISHQVQTSMGDVTHIAGQAIDAYQSVRIYGGQAFEGLRFNEATETARRKDMKVAKVKVINIAGVQFIISIGVTLSIVGSIYLANYVPITAGAFVSLMAAMLQLIKPMKNLSVVNSTIQRGLAAAESIFDLIDKEKEDDSGDITRHVSRGALAFEGVSFSYRENLPVLRNINLTISPGETVALVGHSGGGKSTLVNLIPRFYEPTEGRILLDNIPVRDLTLENLRAHIALVSQHIVLFDDTVFNNITYAKEGVTREAVWQVLEQSYAKDFVASLPQGLDTLIGENGFLLSGGQRQRLAIARAMLKKAPLLILDEATSALDNQTERYIQMALDNIMKSCTTIVIAHRLTTIQKADRIVVIEGGEIIEMGSHDDLYAQGGAYRRLCQSQFESGDLPKREVERCNS